VIVFLIYYGLSTPLMKIYSFPPISNQQAAILILGTMPGERSLKLNQYNGHGGNAFWKLLFMIFDSYQSCGKIDKKWTTFKGGTRYIL
jgi:G:T/U-mismatch repair DNA glycosylase